MTTKGMGLKSFRNPNWWNNGKRVKDSPKQEPVTGSSRGKLKEAEGKVK